MRLKIAEDDPDEVDPSETSDTEVGYLYLSKHPGPGVPGIVKRQIWLHEVIPKYRGPAIYLDFDESDELVGIEIIEDIGGDMASAR